MNAVRQEHRHQREGRGDHRHADFVGRLQRRLHRRLAHAQMARDVLDLDDGVVHQHAHHQRQRQQGHGVERVAEIVLAQEGRNHRQRQRRGRHQGRAPVAQEPPHHQHGQDRAFVQELHRAVEVLLHREGVVDDFLEHHVRMLALQLGDGRARALGHVDLAGALGAEYLEANHFLAVLLGQRARLGHRVAHLGDLVQAHAAPVRQRNVHARQLVGAVHGGDGAHRLLGAADVAASARRLALHAAQLARDVGRRHLQRGHARVIELHADFAEHAADPLDRAQARHAQQPLGDGIVDEPAQFLVVHRIAGAARRGRGGEGQHHPPGGRHLRHGRVAHLGWQVGLDPRDGVAHVVHTLGDGLLEDEFDGDGGHPVEHLGVDVLDPLQGRDRVLDLARHLGFQLGRRGAVEHRGDGHDRQFDVGEVLHFVGLVGQQAGQRQQREQHDRRDRVLDGESGEIHRGSLFGAGHRRCGRGHVAHQVAVVEEAGAADHHRGVRCEAAQHLDALAQAAAGLHL